MRSLVLKLTLAFLIVSLTATLLVVVFAVWSTARQFNRFMSDQNREAMVSQLAGYYEIGGNWLGIPQAFPGLVRGPGFIRGDTAPANSVASDPGSRPLALADASGRVIVAGIGYELGQSVSQEQFEKGEPIEVDGREVGRLIIGQEFSARPSGTSALFLSRVNRAFIIGALVAAALAVVLGILLARSLTRPLRELTEATRAVAQGDLAQQVPVRSQDELGELAASFNQMNADLARSRDQRRQMTADIAHDLRTPLSVIMGHSEALSDGLLPPSKETFEVIHEEAQRLSRLVDDLRTLSLAEAGELPLLRRSISPLELLDRAVKVHTHQANEKEITLIVDVEPDLPEMSVDPDRMAQVLDNLLNNAIRYSPTGGQVFLTATSSAGGVQLAVHDSGPGIPAEELPNIFERFYKGDKSRQRHEEEGSGLGLAISKSIVEAHGGRISAESEVGQGMIFIVTLSASVLEGNMLK